MYVFPTRLVLVVQVVVVVVVAAVVLSISSFLRTGVSSSSVSCAL